MPKNQLKEQKAFHGHQSRSVGVLSEARGARINSLAPFPQNPPEDTPVSRRGAPLRSPVMGGRSPVVGISSRRGAPLRSPVVGHGGTYTRTRIVRTPNHIQPSTWNVLADRREQLRRAHTKPHTYTAPVPRTLAQTGMAASNGRMYAISRPQSHPDIPVRRSPIDRARHGRNKGFFAKLLAFLIVLVIGTLGLNFALASPNFRVQQAHIVGTQNPLLISNIQHMGIQGQSIFFIDTTALTARITMSPMVASVTISKQWPNQLTVTVAERIPALLWQTQNGIYSVDSQGIVIAPAYPQANHLMTVIDTTGTSIRPGIRLNQADIAFALQVFAHLPQVTGITTFTLHYTATDPAHRTTPGGSYIIESPDGWQAYLGTAHDTNPLDNRLIELHQILTLAQTQQLNLATIDLRFGLRPVYTLKIS